MAETRVEFRRFHHVVVAVPDLDAAVADWTGRLGWPAAAVSDRGARFELDDAYIQLEPATDRGAGVTRVSVVVDDVGQVAERLIGRGVTVTMAEGGHATVDPAAINGVPMELRVEDADRDGDTGASTGPAAYRRFNHIIVAVSDDEAAKNRWADLFGAWPPEPGRGGEVVHHVPVGIAWFGLTGSGTDASALGRFLERRGEGVYGLALVIDDPPGHVAALEALGAQIIRQESSGQTFLHPKTTHGILIDLVPERHPSRLA